MIPLSDLIRTFGRIGLLSFGGPAAQIALMHRVLVEERRWLSEKQFLQGLSFCMLLPGPEAMQLATWAGWKQRGTLGGLIAGLLFVLPGAVVIAALAYAYAAWGTLPQTAALMDGVKACVIVLVIEALHRVSKKALKRPTDLLIAALAFAALFLLHLPFPLVIVLAALDGALRAQHAEPVAVPPATPAHPLTVPVWLTLWLAPLAVLWLTGQRLLFDIGLFFAKLAVVTFGGAYAVLAWMAQAVVEDRHWLTAQQMVDALGLAETTPGPLILVTQFTGQLTAHLAGGPWLALAASVLVLWVTFVPCFLWIFALAPHVESLLARPRLQAALSAITAAVVGVIANLSLWFALHVLFAFPKDSVAGTLPDPATLRWSMLPLIALAALLAHRKMPVPLMLVLCGLAGWALEQAL